MQKEIGLRLSASRQLPLLRLRTSPPPDLCSLKTKVEVNRTVCLVPHGVRRGQRRPWRRSSDTMIQGGRTGPYGPEDGTRLGRCPTGARVHSHQAGKRMDLPAAARAATSLTSPPCEEPQAGRRSGPGPKSSGAGWAVMPILKVAGLPPLGMGSRHAAPRLDAPTRAGRPLEPRGPSCALSRGLGCCSCRAFTGHLIARCTRTSG